MRHDAVSSRYLYEPGRRLTGGFHLAEDQAAVRTLRECPLPMAKLDDLLHGRRVFRGPIFKRIYAADAKHGRPYVSAKDLVKADIPRERFLSKLHGSLLDELTLHEGMILLTCSGMNLGQAIWTRADMTGLCATHDLLRLEVDEAECPPGYVFAFLASRYGHASVRRQIYGGNIKHIEPHHVARLLVPRLSPSLEARAHALVVKGAAARTRALLLYAEANDAICEELNGVSAPGANPDARAGSFVAVSSGLQQRMDAFYFSPRNQEARASWDRSQCNSVCLGDVAEVFIPGIFKRRFADDARYGRPYVSGAEAFKIAPRATRFLSFSVAKRYRLAVRAGTILIQEAGQLGGLVGRSVLAGRTLDGFAVSNNMVRVTPNGDEDVGFLFALLASEAGTRLIAREAAGSSIPHLDAARVRRLRIPWPTSEVRARIGDSAVRATRMRDEAAAADDAAKAIVESAIEEAT